MKESKLSESVTVDAGLDVVSKSLLQARISFFKYIGLIVEPFLRLVQSDKPLALFMYQELEKMYAKRIQ